MKKLSAEHPVIDENVSKRIEQARSGNVCPWLGTSDCGPGNCDFHDVCPELALDKANARIRELEADLDRWFRDHRILSEAFIRQCDRADRLAVIADALAEELTITHDATIVSEGISIAVNLGGDLKDGESAASWVKRVIKERNRVEAKVKEYDQHIRWEALNLGKALADAAEQKGRADRAEAKLRELVEAAEWRDECRETAPFRPTWAGSDNSRIRCCNLDYFGNEELAKTKQAAEAAYQAALKAAKEG